MEPIHYAAYDGDEEEVVRLVEEDGQRLNAQVQGVVIVRGYQNLDGCTPLMLAAYTGHDRVVARLLELGADVGMVDSDRFGLVAAFWACEGRCASTLALLLDAGTSLRVRNAFGSTLLMDTADRGAMECVKLLLARGGDAPELDVQNRDARTALHYAAYNAYSEIVRLLLQAGADPTIRDSRGETPLKIAGDYYYSIDSCIPLLKAAVAEPQRLRLLLKARALLDAAHAVEKARSDTRTRAGQSRAAVAAAPAYLKGRVGEGRQLPAVTVKGKKQELVACVEYAVEGMVKELFVELCELMVPKWDRAHV